MKDFFVAIKKYQHDIYFVVVGLVMAALIITLFVQALGFVAGEIGRGLETDSTGNTTVHFNIDGLRQLNLGAPATPVSSSTQTP